MFSFWSNDEHMPHYASVMVYIFESIPGGISEQFMFLDLTHLTRWQGSSCVCAQSMRDDVTSATSSLTVPAQTQNDPFIEVDIIWLPFYRRHFPDYILEWKLFHFELHFISVCSIAQINKPVLIQKMAWLRTGNRPSSEPTMVSSLLHLCVAWTQ